jgi:hypothetical protein
MCPGQQFVWVASGELQQMSAWSCCKRKKPRAWQAGGEVARRAARPLANQLPAQIETMIVRLKAEKPHWGGARFASCWSGGPTAMGAAHCRVARQIVVGIEVERVVPGDRDHVVQPLDQVARSNAGDAAA